MYQYMYMLYDHQMCQLSNDAHQLIAILHCAITVSLRIELPFLITCYDQHDYNTETSVQISDQSFTSLGLKLSSLCKPIYKSTKNVINKLKCQTKKVCAALCVHGIQLDTYQCQYDGQSTLRYVVAPLHYHNMIKDHKNDLNLNYKQM